MNTAGFLSVRGIAERLRVHPVTVKRWIHEGRLIAVMESRRGGWKIDPKDLDDFIEENPQYRTDTIEAMMFQQAKSRVCKDILIGLHEMQKKFLVEGHGKVYSEGWNAAMDGFDRLIKESIVEV